MTQSLRYLFIEPIDHLHHQFVNLSTSQSDTLPSFVPPAQTDILPIFGNLFVLPGHSLTYCPALACNLFFSGFLLCPTNPLSTESMIKVQATSLLQYVPPDVDPPASYVCNPSQNGQTVTELDRNLIHGRISFFNKCCWHPQFTWETTFYGGDRIGPEFGDGLIKVRADFDNCYDISPGYKVWLKQYVWWHWWRTCLCLCIFSFFRRNIW